MNYQKYNVGAYNLHVIKTKKFKTISIEVIFKRLFTKDDITIRNLLSDVLMTSTKNYNNERLFNIEKQNLYSLKVSSNNLFSGKYTLMNFKTTFLNEKYTEKDYNKKSIEFFFDILFKPNANDNKFDRKSFDENYKALKERIETFEEDLRSYSLTRLLEELDKTNTYGVRYCGYLKDLEKITPKKLYEYYETLIRKDITDIYVIGDVDDEEIKKIITEYFKVNTLKKESGSHFISHDKFRKTVKTIKEVKDINQSKLLLGFKIEDMDLFERQYVTYIYSYILGGSADSKLFKNVREKNSLCYYVSAGILRLESLMVISSGIDKKNYKKAVSLIKKEVKNMQEGKFTIEDINNGKITYKSGIKSLEDKPSNIVGTYASMNYLGYDPLDEKIKNVDKIDKDMIVKFAKKIHLDTIYLLEGEDHD